MKQYLMRWIVVLLHAITGVYHVPPPVGRSQKKVRIYVFTIPYLPY